MTPSAVAPHRPKTKRHGHSKQTCSILNLMHHYAKTSLIANHKKVITYLPCSTWDSYEWNPVTIPSWRGAVTIGCMCAFIININAKFIVSFVFFVVIKLLNHLIPQRSTATSFAVYFHFRLYFIAIYKNPDFCVQFNV